MKPKSSIFITILLCLAVLVGVTFEIVTTQGEPAASFRVENVVWGTPTNNPIAVRPGDSSTPLTVYVRNRSNYRLNGIFATFYLNSSFGGIYQFTNSSGGFESLAVGQAEQIGDILYPTGEVLPGTAFTLTFTLNIDPDAKHGNYAYKMKIEYLVNQSGIITEGETQILEAIITMPNRTPTIDSFSPDDANPIVYLGEFINFSAVCHDPDGDELNYRWILDDAVVGNLTWFQYRPQKKDLGAHTLQLRVTDGTLSVTQSWKISVPNRAPIIDAFTPRNTSPKIYLGDSLNFSVTCHDLDGDVLTYWWTLDDIVVSYSSWFIYKPTDKDIRSHSIVLDISDGTSNTTQSWTVSVDRIKATSVTASPNYLIGGQNNVVNITLRNNFWKGTVQIEINLPPQIPSMIDGHNLWTFRNVSPEDFLTIEPKIYVPATSIGTTLTSTVTATYTDEYGREFTDAFAVGFVVKGLINIVVYDINIDPQPVQAGETVSITATLLNKGNIPATNLNASIQSNPFLKVSSLSKFLINEIDENSPEPVSLKATVISNLNNGTYPVVVAISYMDDELLERTMEVTVHITVIDKTENNTIPNKQTFLEEFFRNGGWTIIVLVATTIIIVIFYMRRMMKKTSWSQFD